MGIWIIGLLALFIISTLLGNGGEAVKLIGIIIVVAVIYFLFF